MGNKDSDEAASLKWTLFSTILYGFCSGSMNFLNKYILSYWSFHEPGIIMFSQMVFLSFGLFVLKSAGRITLVDYTPEKARIFLPLTVIYSVNSIMSLSALTGMNIPMYNAIRRCVPIASLVLGFCMLRKQKTTFNIVISIFIITAGTFIAAIGDLDFDLKGYVYGVLSIVSQALYLITLQRLDMEHNIGALSISYINSINCLPVMALIVICTGEINSIVTFEHWHNPGFIISFIALVLYGCLFTYSMFLCTTVNSALTTALVGVAKSAITTMVGMYTFGGVTATALMIVGQIVNLSGAVLYTYEKYRMKMARKEKIKPTLSSKMLDLGHDLKSDSDLFKLVEVSVHNQNLNGGIPSSHNPAPYTKNGHVNIHHDVKFS
uniref:UDP-galactose/UDP-glucose transporter 7-like n=1 Tax=Styela clava TaxID=7725 RepID=UPI0019398A41|nr:UDP-galactose/UDP-glucose transporter 7-like [Styela clava]